MLRVTITACRGVKNKYFSPDAPEGCPEATDVMSQPWAETTYWSNSKTFGVCESRTHPNVYIEGPGF